MKTMPSTGRSPRRKSWSRNSYGKEVYAALMQLPAIQARRIYARFYLSMTVAEIAQIEGTDRRRVWDSIRRGLKKLARLLDAAQ